MLLAAPSVGLNKIPLPIAHINAMKNIQLLHTIVPKIVVNSAAEDHWSVRASMRTTTALYLAVLPSRAGENVAMDSAVQCLATAVRLYYSNVLSIKAGEVIATSEDMNLMLGYHINALNCLRQALNDPVQASSAETLCATELLCCFEVRLNLPLNRHCLLCS